MLCIVGFLILLAGICYIVFCCIVCTRLTIRISSQGNAIIITRNHSLAFKPAFTGLEITSWNAQTRSRFLFSLLNESIGSYLKAKRNSALALSKRLSEHTLAISYMAGLIHDRKFSIQQFMTMYLRNPSCAHAANKLAVLLDFSFMSLDKNSLSILGVISFLMPDIISQELFEAGTNRKLPEDLDFCSDNFR